MEKLVIIYHIKHNKDRNYYYLKIYLFFSLINATKF